MARPPSKKFRWDSQSDHSTSTSLLVSTSLPGTPSNQKRREGKNAAYRDRRYEILLGLKGSFLSSSEVGVTPEDETLCATLLNADQPLPESSLFDDDIFEQVCKEIREQNEARVIKDIGLLIVPSAENLALRDRKYKILIESSNEGWNKAIPFEGTRPQPDYAVGFRRSAFGEEQLAKLQLKFDVRTHFAATEEMLFPFFTSEVKCGSRALDTADRQNAHSMTVAVKGIVELYRIVKRQNELHRKVLAFSVSHDQQNVRIYAHYPLIEGSGARFYRHLLKDIDFVSEHGKEKWTAYRFTRNVYDRFVPEHHQRIQSALDQLPDINPPSRVFDMKPALSVKELEALAIKQGKTVDMLKWQVEQDRKEMEHQMAQHQKELEQYQNAREQYQKEREQNQKQIQQLIELLSQGEKAA